MTSIGSPSPFFLAGKKAYSVDRSLRFNAADSAYLNRTTASGNRRSFSISVWIKRAKFASQQIFVSTGDDGSNQGGLQFLSGDTLNFFSTIGNTYYELTTTQVFRDPSAWYHIVAVFDTENSTSGDRIRLYVNGARITAFGTETQPSQNYDSFWNQSGKGISLGIYEPNNSGLPLGGYMAEINFIDGFAYDPSYFGETNPLTGQWNPKKYVGSYGTNGFYLNFSDNSGTTATTLGKDSSGNGNNFTPNNLSVYDSMPDTPTNNFAVMNPLTNYSGLSQGNLRFNNYNDSGGNRSTQATFALPKSGKWYLEARYQEDYIHSIYMGLSQIQMNTGYVTTPTVYYNSLYGTIEATGESNVSGGSWYNIGSGNSVILSMAIDVDNNSVKFYKDNSLQGTITLPTITSLQEYFFTWANSSGGSSGSLNNTFNFGADSTFQGQETSGGNTDANGIGDFKYAPPSGHLALCSANLPTPTILLPNAHFGIILYTGNGADDRNITDSSAVNFTPDWVWIKSRNQSEYHSLFDAVRGANKSLYTNYPQQEESLSETFESFDSNGFTVGYNSSYSSVFTNKNSTTYVAWNWNAGDTDGKTYTVKVVSDSGNKYRFDNFGTSAVTLDLAEGGTYIFDQSDSSNAGHPLRFYTAADKTGGEYTTGVTTAGTPGSSGAYTQIVVAASAPTLFYQCSVHAGMGGQANTNSTLGSSNFDGTIQSVAKVNASAGFSITKYTGTGSAGATVGHGLGVAPNVIIIKNRTDSSSSFWAVYHSAAFNSASDPNILYLNSTNAESDDTNVFGTSVTIDSTKFSLGDYNGTNGSSDNMISYCFSEVEGYSKFGSYTPNQNDNGPFVYTGFRPRWILLKSRGNIYGGGSPFSGNWYILDTERSIHNVAASTLASANNNAEDNAWGTEGIMDILSNGFKIRTDSLGINANLSGSFIYLAFAEAPFKYARAR